MGQTGGCLCGAVRYEITAEPAMTAICHCKNCQRQAGTALSVIVGFARDGIEITGETTTYADKGESGHAVLRKFCPSCGSPLFTDAQSAPQLLWVKAGTLDDTSWLKPKIQFWTKSKQDWLKLDETIPAVETNPPG